MSDPGTLEGKVIWWPGVQCYKRDNCYTTESTKISTMIYVDETAPEGGKENFFLRILVFIGFGVFSSCRKRPKVGVRNIIK